MYEEGLKFGLVMCGIILILNLIFRPIEVINLYNEISAPKQPIITETTIVEQVFYATPTGKKYHYKNSCAGDNAFVIDEAKAKKTYAPCKKCVKQKSDKSR